MIPLAYIQAWTERAPWPDLRQIEQDLLISRAICDLFSSEQIAGSIAFRGGTAIHKLLFAQPLRYSEDIDLVQATPGPIGSSIDAIRAALSWLGTPKREQAQHSLHLRYRFAPEIAPSQRLNVKVELNTREHNSAFDRVRMRFRLDSAWHSGDAEVLTFEPEELFGTKLRALLQRRKNRDLFDLHRGLQELSLDPERIVRAFEHYLEQEGGVITRAQAEQTMLAKLTRSLTEDITPLLPNAVTYGNTEAIAAFEQVWRLLIHRLRGEPWRSTERVLADLRETSYPELLRG